jgi:hypothetical protein
MRFCMALCRAYVSTNAIYVVIGYEENQNQQIWKLLLELEKDCWNIWS